MKTFSFKIPFTNVKISIFVVFIAAIMLFADFSLNTAIVFLCALIHETGHILAMKHFGVKIRSICVYPFGAVINSDAASLHYKKEMWVALGGAEANFISSVVAAGVLIFFKNQYVLFFIFCNVLLALVNLMPVKTFDGGVALKSLLLCYLSEDKAENVADTASYLSFVFLTLAAFALLVVTGYNFSLMVFCIYVFIFAYVRLPDNKL